MIDAPRDATKKSGKKRLDIELQNYPICESFKSPDTVTSLALTGVGILLIALDTRPGSVLLLGTRGVSIAMHPWALSVEFQFDELNPEAFVGARKYSVLASR